MKLALHIAMPCSIQMSILSTHYKCNMYVQLVELSAHLLACFLAVTAEFVQKVDFR